MYLRDARGVAVLSSLDGKEMDLTSVLPSGLEPAVAVPAFEADVLATGLPWTGDSDNYKGK